MLQNLRPAPGSRRRPKRVARGNSAGGGTTAGRGTKGQQARAGKGRAFGFEGGQTPLLRRQPKLGGFTPPQRIEYEELTLKRIENALEPGTYDVGQLRARRLLSSGCPVKLLATGTVTKKFELTVHAASKAAKEAIEQAGGTITFLR